MRTFDATPKASMLIESMRDIGYSLETAMADVIDNSVAANARNIGIYVDTGSADIKIGIVDDGIGMSEKLLYEAMRPGNKNPLDARFQCDLGRFGLGLKTASFSQCRRLTVVTRQNGVTSAAIWDLDFVAQQNKWLIQTPDNLDLIPWINSLGENGTLVVWENMDRLVEQIASAEAFNNILIIELMIQENI